VRRIPDPTRRLVFSPDAQDELGGAVPSPAAAFLLTLILLPTLFWLVALKRTTEYLGLEGWLMGSVMQPLQAWMEQHLPALDSALTAISALGSGWFVALGFAFGGLFALYKGRRDLALLLALGTLAFPMEWALKYFVAIPPITLPQLFSAMLNVNDVALMTSPFSRRATPSDRWCSTGWLPSASRACHRIGGRGWSRTPSPRC
jgi:hypothetical protein